MTPGAIAVLSLSMSTDAFAAAVGRGASHRPNFAGAVRAGAVFGVIEAVTPVIGWGLGPCGRGPGGKDRSLDRLRSPRRCWRQDDLGGDPAPGGGRGRTRPSVRPWALVATAVGTSIDAAAVGVGLAFLGANIWIIALSIGLTTFVLTTTGMLIGRAVGGRFGKAAELIGGLALIALGSVILIEHLTG